MSSSEFDIIRRYFMSQTVRRADVSLGIGDDAAVLTPPPGQQLVVTTDTLLAGVHFPGETNPEAIGHKVLAVNLSDLAAMGATPAWVTLSLTLPAADEAWLTAFADGFFTLAQDMNVQLVGGDTTRGPLSITVQAMGFVPHGQAITRSGAKVGDNIYVTGTLGDAAAGLALRLGKQHAGERACRELIQRLERPAPRLGVGQALRGLASACIDISDGLVADLGHILEASRVGAEVNIDTLPLSAAFRSLDLASAWKLAVSGGDDYELCFTASPARASELEARLSALDCPYTCIGLIAAGKGIRWLDAAGQAQGLEATGYDHFVEK